MSNRNKKVKAAEPRVFKTHELFLAGFMTVMLCVFFIKGVSVLVVNFFEIMYVAINYSLNHGFSSVVENWMYLTVFEKAVLIVIPILQIFFIVGAFKFGYKVLKIIGQVVLSSPVLKNIF